MLTDLAAAWANGAALALVHGTLVVLAAALVFRAFPRIGAATRHRVWLAMLALLVMLSAPGRATGPSRIASATRAGQGSASGAIVAPAQASGAGARAVGQVAQSPSAPEVSEVSSTASPDSPRVDAPATSRWRLPLAFPVRLAVSIDGALWISILFVLWLACVALQLVAIVRAAMATRKLARGAEPLSRELAGRVAMLLGGTWTADAVIERRALRVSDAIAAPITVGMRRPAVLLPAALVAELTDDELRDVLLHELAHVARRDGWAMLWQRVCRALLVHHPAAWWIGRQLTLEREHACDAAVVRRTGAPKRYARSLVRVAELTALRPALPLAAGVVARGLSVRVESILSSEGRVPVMRPVSMLTGTLAIAGLALAPMIRVSAPRPSTPALASIVASAPPPATLVADTTLAGMRARVDSTLRSFVPHGFAGVVLFARNGQIVLHEGYGLADRERGIPMTRDTYFSAAGMTKALTAAAILTLADQGRLRIDERVSDVLGPFPGAKSAVTLHHLLTYTDGLSRPGADVARGDARAFVAAMKATPAAFAPGAASRYTDVGHSLLGIVIERVTGTAYEDWVRRDLLARAGMTATRFENERLPAGAVVAREYEGWPERQTPVVPRSYVWGRRASLGLVTTAGDLHRLLTASHDSAFLGARVRDALFTPRVTTGAGTVQGYGWDIIETRRGTTVHRRLAGTPGMEGELIRDVTDRWDAVILVNSAVGWRYAVWRELEAAVHGNPRESLGAVLAKRRHAPYRGGAPIPVTELAASPLAVTQLALPQLATR